MKKLVRRLQNHEFRTAYRVIADQLSLFLSKLIHRDWHVPVWILAATIIPSTALVGYWISLQAGHRSLLMPLIAAPLVISTVYISVLVIVCEHVINYVLNVFSENVLDSIPSASDQRLFTQRLESVFSIKRQVLFGAVFSLIIHLIFLIPAPNLITVYGWPVIVANVIINFFHGVCVYFVFSFAVWLYRDLSNYDFELYSVDPSSSKMIQVLFRTFNVILYNIVIMIAIVSITLGLFKVFPPVSILISIVLMWGIAISIFFSNIGVLSNIIRKSKQKALDEIQLQIKELQSKDPIASGETLDHIAKLIDYHNKIKSSPDSPLNLRSFLEFLSSLALPTVGVIISNLQDALKLYQSLKP